MKKLQEILTASGVKLHRTKAMEGNDPKIWKLQKPDLPEDVPIINKYCVHEDHENYRMAGDSGH